MSLVNSNEKYNYLALGGVGKWEAIKTYLDKGNIKKIIIATDNDKTNDNQGGIPCAQLMCSFVKENYPAVERKWPKLDEIEKIQKASKKKHGNLTETVEQTVNDWEK